MAAFVPVPFCSHSLMDRISDSGSDGLGSNPDGSTKNAFVGIYRPYSGKNTGMVLQKTLPVFFTPFIIGKTNRDEIQNQMRLKFARKLQKRNVTEKSRTSYSQKWLSKVN